MCSQTSSVPAQAKDAKTVAKEARAWVASQEGQRQIEEALVEAKKVTSQLSKSHLVETGNLRVPFSL